MADNKIIIAIDGYAACGKSTLARSLASALSYIYIDSGSMYRAVSYYFLENEVDFENKNQCLAALKNIIIDFSLEEGKQMIFLNNENVEKEIRSMEVSEIVSNVAKISSVRRHLVKIQRTFGSNRGIVMDGRDIGTVVFPDAELKIFLQADKNVRANRRQDELVKKGLYVSLEEIAANLEKRDQMDSTRKDSPLVAAPDAVKIDNTNLSIEEQFAISLKLAELRSRK